MKLALVSCLAFAWASLQDVSSRPDDVRRLALDSSDASLEGHGFSRSLSYTTDFSGTLFVWASSRELDAFVRVEDDRDALVAEDEDSGGGKTAFVAFEVEPGGRFTIRAASSAAGATGEIELHIVPIPESRATRAAARAAREELDGIARHRASGTPRSAEELTGSRELVTRIVSELAGESGRGASTSLALAQAGNVAFDLGEYAVARTAWEDVLAFREAHLNEDHPQSIDTGIRLGSVLLATRETGRAKELFHRILDAGTPSLGRDHPEMLKARQGLASAARYEGDLRGALALERELLESCERTLPEDDRRRQVAKGYLGSTLLQLGEAAESLPYLEQAAAVLSRTLAPEDPDLATTRGHQALALKALGRVEEARSIEEDVLAAILRCLPDDHPLVQRTRNNLAVSLVTLGDSHRARELFEKVLEVRERTLPEGHPDLLRARSNLATILSSGNDPRAELRLRESIVESLSRSLPDDHPDLLVARQNLVASLQEAREIDRALEVAREVLDTCERTLSEEHDLLLAARANLASMLIDHGDPAGARELCEQVLRARARRLPDDHASVLESKWRLATVLTVQGDREAASRLLMEMAASLRGSLRRAAASEAPRVVEARARGYTEMVGRILSSAAAVPGFEPPAEVVRACASLVESFRGIAFSTASFVRASHGDPELARLGDGARSASRELVTLLENGSNEDELMRARRVQDDAQRALVLRAAGAEGAVFASEPAPELLSGRIEPGEAIVGYWQYVRSTPAEDPAGSFALLAFVIRSEGHLLARIELGPLEPIAAAVLRYRQAIGVSSAPTRGVEPAASTSPGAPDAEAAGAELRRLAFDPLLPALSGCKRVLVAFDGSLHGVPLDALPFGGEGELLGEHFEIDVYSTLWELGVDPSPSRGEPLLVAVGGVAYDLEESSAIRSERAHDASTAEAGTRDRRPTLPAGFAPLPGTEGEIASIAELARGMTVKSLRGSSATKAALLAVAPSARFLHLATHGWFAPEAPSESGEPGAAARSDPQRPMSLEERIEQMTPMVLCGLALAGANARPGPEDRGNGRITAEEIAALDLSCCDLAVLSACDTNVGVEHLGQGVASLQKALHMAGARSAITSLWKVPDEATRSLMVDFYRRLWVEKQSKRQALWEAKMQIRDAKDATGKPKYTTRDWAAWVLTGNSD